MGRPSRYAPEVRERAVRLVEDLDLDTAPGVSYPNRRETPPLSWTAFEFIVVPGGGHVLQPITRVGAYTTATRIHTVTAA